MYRRAPSLPARCQDVSGALITSVERASNLTDERAYRSAWQLTSVLKSGGGGAAEQPGWAGWGALTPKESPFCPPHLSKPRQCSD